MSEKVRQVILEDLRKTADHLDCKRLTGEAYMVRAAMQELAALRKQNDELKRYKERDLKAAIELTYDNGTNPFARETLKVVDVSVSDNTYVVESETVAALRKQNELLENQIKACDDVHTQDTQTLAELRKRWENLKEEIEFVLTDAPLPYGYVLKTMREMEDE